MMKKFFSECVMRNPTKNQIRWVSQILGFPPFFFNAPNFEKVGSILLSACPSVHPCVRPFKKKFKARVLNFHIWIPCQKIAYLYFFLVRITSPC